MIIVSDTTPLNYLILTGTVDVLPAIFGRVYAPSAVIKELSHPRSPEIVRTWASSPPMWLTVQDPIQTDRSLTLGVGEVAAISLALELKADRVLIDERKGYKAALQRSLQATTTLGLLEEASYRGLIDFEAAIERLSKETTFYVTEHVLEEFRRRVRERVAQVQRPPEQAP
jgi:predicted nucleic acid-binding protein